MLQAKSQTNVCLANVPSLRSPMAPTPPPPPKKGILMFIYFLILLLDIGVTSVNADDIFFMFQVFVVEVRRTPPTLKEGLSLMIVMLICC